MGDAEADRTLDRPTLRALDDEDVAEALRTCQTPVVDDEYALGGEMPTTPALPSDEGDSEGDGVSAERTQEIGAEGTQEIRAVDILEEHPVVAAANAPEPADIPIDEGEPEEPRSTASSIAPFALEIELPHVQQHRPLAPSDSSGTSEVSFATRVKPTRRLRAVVEITMAASLLIIAAGAVRAHLSPTNDEPPTIVLPAAAAAAPLAPAQETKPAEPLPATGTLVRVTRAKLTVDGVPITAPSALVPCGSHVVKVGAEKARTVDVPCGGSLAIDQAHR